MNDIDKYKDLNEIYWAIGNLRESRSIINNELKNYNDFCTRLEWQAERLEKSYNNLKKFIDKYYGK